MNPKRLSLFPNLPHRKSTFLFGPESRFWTKSKQSVLNKTNSGTIPTHSGFVSNTISERLSFRFWHFPLLWLTTIYKYWWLMPLYWIFISFTILMMVFCWAHIVVHTIFYLGFCLVGVGLMWIWSSFLHWSRIDEFVFGLKSVDDLCHFPPMGIGSADTSQPPKGEICMDNSQ